MINAYMQVKNTLLQMPKTWLVTGVAGFIGSNLLETLLKLDQRVIGIDNFSTGHHANLVQVKALVTPKQWANFHLFEADIRDIESCRAACVGVDYVLHQAALGSVPRSIENPIQTNENNISGFLNILVAARDAGVKSFVYAASSSTYGDHPGLPKKEEVIGKPLSPYAVTKYVNELYADVFSKCYGFNTIGLRYFNVFGPRQDPEGAYAAVIPKWIASMIRGEQIYINGNGETSRDFCFVENAVQANLLAACTTMPEAINQVYNVAVNDKTSLNQLFEMIRTMLVDRFPHLSGLAPVYRGFRAGDVLHSQADISKAKNLLGYSPTHRVMEGLLQAREWYIGQLTPVKRREIKEPALGALSEKG